MRRWSGCARWHLRRCCSIPAAVLAWMRTPAGSGSPSRQSRWRWWTPWAPAMPALVVSLPAACCVRTPRYASTRALPPPPPPRLAPAPARMRRRGRKWRRCSRAAEDRLQHPQHFVARAHGVVVGLAGRALLVVEPGVVRAEDAVPGAMPVVDEVGPAVGPHAVVPLPVARVASALRQQRGGGQRLGLHPEVLVGVVHRAIRIVAVDHAAVHR